VADTGSFHLDQDFAGFWPVQLDVRDRERLGFLECNGGMVFMAISSSASRSARVELEDTGAKITRRERGPRNGAMAAKLNSVMNIPPDPSHRWRRGAHMGSGPSHATSHFEKKLQVSIEKHYTKKPD